MIKKIIAGEKGFIVIYMTVLVLALIFSFSASMFVLTYGRQKISQNSIRSAQAYYSAESGLEDAVYRLKKSMNLPSNYLIPPDVQISLQSPNANTRIITANAVKTNVSKKLETIVTIKTINPQFFYGAQAGDLGVKMENNSRIEGAGGAPGNVYSNGPIDGDNGAVITGSVFAAGTSSLGDITILGDAHANSIYDSKICGDAFYQTIDSSSLNFVNNPSSPSCLDPLTPGAVNPGSSDSPLQNMPISDTDINQWKQEAEVGGIYSGNLNISSNISYGPKKIDGNLIMTSSNKILTVTGTLFITGYIDIDNGSRIRCDAAYGLNSCVVVADKWAHISNNGVFQGSGQSGSYIMILTTSSCDGSSSVNCTHHNAAMDLHNGATGAIFYANGGLIYLHNGVVVSELTAKKINLEQGAIVRYEQGLVNAGFTSGPGGSWQVDSWKEVE